MSGPFLTLHPHTNPRFHIIDPYTIPEPPPGVTPEQIVQYEEQKKSWGSLARDPHAKPKAKPKQHKPTKRRETTQKKVASKLEAGQANILQWATSSQASGYTPCTPPPFA